VVGGPAQTGYVNMPGDNDRFNVDLVAGQRYTFTLTGSGTSPLQDSYLELRDPSGALIAVDG
jgi:serralysin